jgi:anti-anti-sigma factor
MEIGERRTGTTTVLALTGRLTVNDRPGMLKDRVAVAVQEGATRVLLDLSGVVYIDSTRLGELIAAHITVSRTGGRLGLVGTPRRIHELLTMAGLDGVFEQFASTDDAVQH